MAALFVLTANTVLRPGRQSHQSPAGAGGVQRGDLRRARGSARRAAQIGVLQRTTDLLEAAHYPIRSIEQQPFGSEEIELEAVLYATAVDADELDAVMTAISRLPGVSQAFWNASAEE